MVTQLREPLGLFQKLLFNIINIVANMGNFDRNLTIQFRVKSDINRAKTTTSQLFTNLVTAEQLRYVSLLDGLMTSLSTWWLKVPSLL